MATVEIASRVNEVSERDCFVKQRLYCPRLSRNLRLNYEFLSISLKHVRLELILVEIVFS